MIFNVICCALLYSVLYPCYSVFVVTCEISQRHPDFLLILYAHQDIGKCYMPYDTRCYFNVRSKANMSQLNLPHGTNN